MVKLEDISFEHAQGIAKNASNPNLSKFLRSNLPYPYTVEDANKFIRGVCKDENGYAKTIFYNNEIVGIIGLHKSSNKNDELEIGFWLGEPHWGKGIMTEAVKQMVTFGFEELKLNRIFSYAVVENKASHKVHLKAGFTDTGIVNKECKPNQPVDQYTFEYLSVTYFKKQV